LLRALFRLTTSRDLAWPLRAHRTRQNCTVLPADTKV
jgi:hypothetical protein